MLSSNAREDRRRALSLSALASLLLHAMLLPLLLWVLARTYIQTSTPPERLGQSTAVTIERRIAPVHPMHAMPRPHAVTVQPQQPRTTPAPPPPRELARVEPKAPAQPRPQHTPSTGMDLAAQQRAFANEAQRLHAENSNPLAIATAAVDPSTYQHTMIDASGKYNNQERTYAWLRPFQHWYQGDMSCYYATYTMASSQGGSEDGTIPWPICYPRDDDRMIPLDHPHMLPVPVPPAGYKLAADTYLTPFLRAIYDQRPH